MSAKTNHACGLLKFTSLHCRNRGRSAFPTEPSALRAGIRAARKRAACFYEPLSLSLSLTLSLLPESRRSLRNPSIYIGAQRALKRPPSRSLIPNGSFLPARPTLHSRISLYFPLLPVFSHAAHSYAPSRLPRGYTCTLYASARCLSSSAHIPYERLADVVVIARGRTPAGPRYTRRKNKGPLVQPHIPSCRSSSPRRIGIGARAMFSRERRNEIAPRRRAIREKCRIPNRARAAWKLTRRR